MLRHRPRVGRMGLDMMLRTCTIQVNLDYSSEADMVKKFRVSLALQPLATALFANSPFLEGKPNGFLSYRSHIWTDTDPHRTGMLPFVFEQGFGFERRSEEHTSELQSLMRISYAVFCLKKKKTHKLNHKPPNYTTN